MPVLHATFRFGDFELDVAGYQLRRRGRPVRLERQPMDLLILLVERRTELVSRQEIGNALWGNDVFVEVDSGVHTAIRKIRHALRDSADSPKFLETVSGKGYRFIAPVEVSTDTNAEKWTPSDRRLPQRALPERLPEVVGVASASAPPIENRRRTYWWFGLLAVGAVVVAVVFGAAATIGHSGSVSRPAATLAVLPFENLTGDPERQYLADGLAEETIATLGQLDPARLGIIGRTSVMTYKGTTKSLAVIGRELAVDYLLEGAIRTEGSRVRLTSRLIRAADQVQLWSASYERELTSLFDLQKELSTGNCRTDPCPVVAGAIEHPRPPTDDRFCRVRNVLEGPLRRTSAHRDLQHAGGPAFPERDCRRPEVRARVGRPCRTRSRQARSTATPRRSRWLRRPAWLRRRPSRLVQASPNHTRRWHVSTSGSTGTGPRPRPRCTLPSD